VIVPYKCLILKADYAKKNYSNLERVNSAEFSLEITKARFFVIKSYTEDDVHKSMKYQVWSSTTEGNKRLNEFYIKSQEEKVPIFLFFSVNASGQFVGVCKMMSEVTFGEKLAHWQMNEKWAGKFKVEWVFVKDIQNKEFKSIINPSNENKPVTNSRDTQEIPFKEGMRMLEIFKLKKQESSLLDEFENYDNEERKGKEAKHEKESFGKVVQGESRGQHRRGRGPRRGRGRGNIESKKGSEKPEKSEASPAEAATQPPAASAPASNTNQ
jgi:hypothetical protein